MLRLTLLAPDIVGAILNGRQPAEITLAGLMRRFPVGWREQWTDFLAKGARREQMSIDSSRGVVASGRGPTRIEITRFATVTELDEPRGPGQRAYFLAPAMGRKLRRFTVALHPSARTRQRRLRRLIDNAVVKATARAFRWREMLENGTHATIAEIAAAKKINCGSSFVLLGRTGAVCSRGDCAAL